MYSGTSQCKATRCMATVVSWDLLLVRPAMALSVRITQMALIIFATSQALEDAEVPRQHTPHGLNIASCIHGACPSKRATHGPDGRRGIMANQSAINLHVIGSASVPNCTNLATARLEQTNLTLAIRIMLLQAHMCTKVWSPASGASA